MAGALALRPVFQVLVLGDDPSLARLLRRLLVRSRTYRFAVEQLKRYELAVALLRNHPPDIVLVDLLTGDEDPAEALAWMKEMALAAPLLVVASREQDTLVRQALQRGALDAVLVEDLEAAVLQRVVLSAIGRHRRKIDAEHLVDGAPDGVLAVDAEGHILYANRMAQRLLDARDTLVGTRFEVPLEPSSELPLGQSIVDLRVADVSWQGQSARLVLLHDVTVRARRESQLSEAARNLERANQLLGDIVVRDPLTGVLNRRGLEEALRRELERYRRSGAPLCGVLVDCDRFKYVNDQYGHAVGDDVLVQIVRRVQSMVRATDEVGRVGGDEFLLLLPNTGVREAVALARRIGGAVRREPLSTPQGDLRITVSAGVDLVPRHSQGLREVLEQLSSAVGRSKRLGRDQVSSLTLTPTYFRAKGAEGSPASAAYTAVAQPIVNLESGQIAGYEFLIRGEPGAGQEPADLFNAARERGDLLRTDLRCLAVCLNTASRLPRQVIESGLGLHVNLFPTTLRDSPPGELLRLLDARPYPASVCIELSEQQFIEDPQVFRAFIRPLVQRGVRVAIDDVGFGRSSLETLILLEPHVIKVDRRMVHGVAGDPTRRRALSTLVTLGRSLGSETIAEGIESSEDLDAVRQAGIRLGQGFALGRPEAVLPLSPPSESTGV